MANDPAKPLWNASVAFLLGSGLGGASEAFAVHGVLPFAEVPGMSAAGVAGHAGEIVACDVAGCECLFVRGRKHHYEGPGREIEALIGFLGNVGVRVLISTSAAGSLTSSISPGDFVLVEDLIDRQNRRPASGEARGVDPAKERPGREARWTPERTLYQSIRSAASAAGMPVTSGVTATCAGPVYETRAEIRALQGSGVDVVSMSGAPEVAIARRLGIDVALICLVTNWATGISAAPLSHDAVLSNGQRAAEGFGRFVTHWLQSLHPARDVG